jgi:hypothetical protein
MMNDLSQWLIDNMATYPKKYSQITIWREPIMACAPADDRCLQLKEITVCPAASHRRCPSIKPFQATTNGYRNFYNICRKDFMTYPD